RQRIRILNIHQMPIYTLFNYVEWPTHTRRHDWTTARHCLEWGKVEPFNITTTQPDIALCIEVSDRALWRTMVKLCKVWKGILPARLFCPEAHHPHRRHGDGDFGQRPQASSQSL